MAWVGVGHNGRGRIYRWMVWPVGMGLGRSMRLGGGEFDGQKWV